jgi:hypothetical protein
VNPFEIINAIEDFITQNWQHTPIGYQNKKDDLSPPYIDVYIKFGEMANLEIKGAGSRTGITIINVFTEINVGTEQGADFCGKLEELFWHRKIEDIVFEHDLLPYSRDLGLERDAIAYQHQVVIPFTIITEV